MSQPIDSGEGCHQIVITAAWERKQKEKALHHGGAFLLLVLEVTHSRFAAFDGTLGGRYSALLHQSLHCFLDPCAAFNNA